MNFNLEYYPPAIEVTMLSENEWKIPDKMKPEWLGFSYDNKPFKLEEITATYPGFKFDKVEIVNAPYLRRSFGLKRDQTHLRSIQIFHATDYDKIESIIRNNFNWRLTQRFKCGKGVSFSGDLEFVQLFPRSSEKRIIETEILYERGEIVTRHDETILPKKDYDSTCSPLEKIKVKFEDAEFLPLRILHISPSQRTKRLYDRMFGHLLKKPFCHFARKQVADQNVQKYLEQRPSTTVVEEAGPSVLENILIEIGQNVIDVADIAGPSQASSAIAETITPTRHAELQYELLKELKKGQKADKRGVMATGGGTYTPVLSDSGARMLSIMSDQVTPLKNTTDSASRYYQKEEDTVVPHLQEVPHDDPPAVVQSQERPKKARRKKTDQRRRMKIDNNRALKTRYYQRLLQSATLEAKREMVEYRVSLKKQKLYDLEVKVRQLELERRIRENQ